MGRDHLECWDAERELRRIANKFIDRAVA
jgi:hypothetical protein